MKKVSSIISATSILNGRYNKTIIFEDGSKVVIGFLYSEPEMITFINVDGSIEESVPYTNAYSEYWVLVRN